MHIDSAARRLLMPEQQVYMPLRPDSRVNQSLVEHVDAETYFDVLDVIIPVLDQLVFERFTWRGGVSVHNWIEFCLSDNLRDRQLAREGGAR